MGRWSMHAGSGRDAMSAALLPYSPLPKPGQAGVEGRSAFGFERLAMFLLPIVEALSTTLGEVPLFNGLKTALFAGLFGLAALMARPPRSMQRGALRWLLIVLGFYTILSRLIYLGVSGADGIAFLAVLLAFPVQLWLLNASLSAIDFHSIMRWFVVGATLGGLISSGLAIQVLMDSGVRGWALVSMEVSSNRNDIAPFYVIALSAIMFLPLGLPRRWAIVCAGILVVAVLLLFSRSGYVALAFPLLLALHAGSKARWVALPLVVVAGVSLVLPGSPIADRINYTFEGHGANELDDSAAGRIEIWRAAIRDFENNPFLGSGSGNSPLPVYDPRHDEILYDHNYFLTQLSQLGIFGLFLTVASLACFVSCARNQDWNMKYFALSAILALLAVSITGEPFYGLVSYLFYVIAIHIARKGELGGGQ